MRSKRFGRMPRHGGILALSAAAALLGTVSSASADLIVTNANTDFTGSPTTISFGGGAATYTFSYLGYDGSSYTVDSVATGGTALVNSSTFPGPGPQPIAFEGGTPIGDNGYDIFTAFAGGAGIAYSIADDFIGLEFALSDGNHFGYAEVAGPTLVSYGFNSLAGGPIATGAAASLSSVPEPASLALMAGGLVAAAGFDLRRRRNQSVAAA